MVVIGILVWLALGVWQMNRAPSSRGAIQIKGIFAMKPNLRRNDLDWLRFLFGMKALPSAKESWDADRRG